MGEIGSVVADYQYDQNIYSDIQSMEEFLSSQEAYEEKVTVITDVVYSSEENRALVKEKNIDYYSIDLTGRKVPDIYADSEFDDQGARIARSLASHKPKSSSYMSPKTM